MDHFPSTFCLNESGTPVGLNALHDLLRGQLDQCPPSGRLMVHANSARSVLMGLLASMRSRDVYLVRDASTLPSPVDWQVNTDFSWLPQSHTNHPPALWLQTSGTTGRPKWVAHRPEHLLQTVSTGRAGEAVWLLTYAPGSFAGVQVMLAALRGGHTLLSHGPDPCIEDFVELSDRLGATHASGTPTFWRAFLRTAHGLNLDFKQITLGGEIADASTLEHLTKRFPLAQVRHIYATSETGVVFTVQDGRAGFPAEWLGRKLPSGVQLKLSPSSTLMVASPRGSLGHTSDYVDTGDVIDVQLDRAFFKGRLDSLVNVGGHKVFPEDVEAHILQLHEVSDVRVYARPSPVTGFILAADIVASDPHTDPDALKRLIMRHVTVLARHARPAVLKITDQLPNNSARKKARLP